MSDGYVLCGGCDELRADKREMEATIAELEARCAKLQKGYAECIDDLQDWGGYASDYFAQKYDFDSTIAAHKKALAEGGEHG